MSNTFRPQDGTGILSEIPGFGIWEAFTPSALFPAVPADGQTGFAPGCTFYNFSGAAGTDYYVNNGTGTSCAFKSVDVNLSLLNGLLATAAQINRNNYATTRAVLLAGNTTITEALHEGRDLILNGTGSAFTQTLPPATGTFDRYFFEVGAVNTSNHVITSATSADLMKGFINVVITASATAKAFASNGSSNFIITLNGTTTGGSNIGGSIELIDVALNEWLVNGTVMGSGAIATPFSG